MMMSDDYISVLQVLPMSLLSFPWIVLYDLEQTETVPSFTVQYCVFNGKVCVV